MKLALAPSAPALFIYDHAPSHGTNEEMHAILTQHHIVPVLVPAKCTHVFQPADMYIISNLKQAASAAWSRWVEDQFAVLPLEQAAAGAENVGNATMKKVMKYRFLSEAIDGLAAATVVRSWQVTGICRALGMEAGTGIIFDQYVAVLETLGDDDVQEIQPPIEQTILVTAAVPIAEKRGTGRPKGARAKVPVANPNQRTLMDGMFTKVRRVERIAPVAPLIEEVEQPAEVEQAEEVHMVDDVTSESDEESDVFIDEE